MPAPLPTLSDITALIRQRRSVKPVDLDATLPVDPTTLETLLENGTWAPNHGLTEPWRFDVFQGTARETLATHLQSIYREVTPTAAFRDDKYAKLATQPLLAPVVVACSMVRSSGDKIPEMEEREAVACALQNIMLSATAAGLGSFWSSPPLLETAPMNAFLGLRPADRCIGLLYLGHPRAGAPAPQGLRRPLAEKVVWHPLSP